MPWDWAYYTERYKSAHYAVDDEQVKPYLRLDNVKKGVFLLANKLYGLNFTPAEEVEVYHPDVEAYDVTDADGSFLAVFYLDFFPRASKRSGAWMTEFRGTSRSRRQRDPPAGVAGDELHEAHRDDALAADVRRAGDLPPRIRTRAARHAGQGKYESLTGTNVYRDFVELPSQIMENWATEKEFLDLWAVHYQTGEPIPAELVERIVAAQNYLAAYANVRQLSFGITDMAWHTLREPYERRRRVVRTRGGTLGAGAACVGDTAMSTAFSHIFAGGYAAGYYGYKWSEVLAADAFSLFQERGIFDRATAASFRHLLEQGDQRPAMDIYVEFRGHRPATEALIREMGIGPENGGTESGGTEDTEATNPEKK